MQPTLVLDLDGTLVDSVPDLAAALNRVLAARGLAPFPLPAQSPPWWATAPAPWWNGRLPPGTRRSIRPRSTRSWPTTRPIAAVQTRAYPGAEAALDALTGQGWRLAVCTNKPERAARALLDALGLAGRFAAIGGGDSYPTPQAGPCASARHPGRRRRCAWPGRDGWVTIATDMQAALGRRRARHLRRLGLR